MKILLTLDLDQPECPERHASEIILHQIWDQLQLTKAKLELLRNFPPKLHDTTYTLSHWAEAASSIENAKKYREQSPSPLEEYDLIIGANLPAGAESFFSSLGTHTMILRAVPCEGFDRFLLARTNFLLPQEYEVPQLPPLKNLYNKNIPLGDISKEERHWWLSNRYLINQNSQDPSILCIGTTACQSERIVDGHIINFSHYVDDFMDLLPTAPNLYYCARSPMDHSELRFMKTINVTCPSLPLPELLARDEIDSLIAIDSGLIPVAKAFQKPLRILGKSLSWSILKTRSFRDVNFLKMMTTTSLS